MEPDIKFRKGGYNKQQRIAESQRIAEAADQILKNRRKQMHMASFSNTSSNGQMNMPAPNIPSAAQLVAPQPFMTLQSKLGMDNGLSKQIASSHPYQNMQMPALNFLLNQSNTNSGVTLAGDMLNNSLNNAAAMTMGSPIAIPNVPVQDGARNLFNNQWPPLQNVLNLQSQVPTSNIIPDKVRETVEKPNVSAMERLQTPPSPPTAVNVEEEMTTRNEASNAQEVAATEVVKVAVTEAEEASESKAPLEAKEKPNNGSIAVNQGQKRKKSHNENPNKIENNASSQYLRRSGRAQKTAQRFGSVPDSEACFCGAATLNYKNKDKRVPPVPDAYNRVNKAKVKVPLKEEMARAISKSRKKKEVASVLPNVGIKDATLKSLGCRSTRKEIVISFLRAAGIDPNKEYLKEQQVVKDGPFLDAMEYDLPVTDTLYLVMLLSQQKFHTVEYLLESYADLNKWLQYNSHRMEYRQKHADSNLSNAKAEVKIGLQNEVITKGAAIEILGEDERVISENRNGVMHYGLRDEELKAVEKIGKNSCIGDLLGGIVFKTWKQLGRRVVGDAKEREEREYIPKTSTPPVRERQGHGVVIDCRSSSSPLVTANLSGIIKADVFEEYLSESEKASLLKWIPDMDRQKLLHSEQSAAIFQSAAFQQAIQHYQHLLGNGLLESESQSFWISSSMRRRLSTDSRQKSKIHFPQIGDVANGENVPDKLLGISK